MKIATEDDVVMAISSAIYFATQEPYPEAGPSDYRSEARELFELVREFLSKKGE